MAAELTGGGVRPYFNPNPNVQGPPEPLGSNYVMHPNGVRQNLNTGDLNFQLGGGNLTVRPNGGYTQIIPYNNGNNQLIHLGNVDDGDDIGNPFNRFDDPADALPGASTGSLPNFGFNPNRAGLPLEFGFTPAVPANPMPAPNLPDPMVAPPINPSPFGFGPLPNGFTLPGFGGMSGSFGAPMEPIEFPRPSRPPYQNFGGFGNPQIPPGYTLPPIPAGIGFRPPNFGAPNSSDPLNQVTPPSNYLDGIQLPYGIQLPEGFNFGFGK